MAPLFERLAILGLGLMGGSLALVAQAKGLAREIVACDPNRRSLTEALQRGVILQGFERAQEAVQGADGVLLAAPVRAILRLLPEIAPALAEGVFVMDLGSTKREIVAALDALPSHCVAVGGHPMAGKEVAGFGAAAATLFRGATFALCPTARTDERARQVAEALVAALEAQPLWIDATLHDEAVARISHLPHLLAGALAQAATPAGAARRMAASGYRDTSRLALTNTDMLLDILLTNTIPIREALGRARMALDTVDRLLEFGDEAALRAWWEEARQRR